ncbi:MAG TPA: choice-of-anchor D domain-containing protein [Candidatus Acidoferrum sp.]|nr:choice-of-anchor D domain-containing protein [Candidatus Acidoferrum sp.]
MRRELRAALLVIGGIFALAAVGQGGFVGATGKKDGHQSKRFTKTLPSAATDMHGFEIPLGFEPTPGTKTQKYQFIAQAPGMAAALGREGISIQIAPVPQKGIATRGTLDIRFSMNGREVCKLRWKGQEKLSGVTNYLIGRDRKNWRLGVAKYGSADADVSPGISARVYGKGGELEYDLGIQPRASVADFAIELRGSKSLRLDRNGNLWMSVAGRSLEMKRPRISELRGPKTTPEKEAASATWISTGERAEQSAGGREIAGGYVLREKTRVGFWIGPHDSRSTIVIDPALTVNYSTFLGGPGGADANSVAVDSSGNVYVAGVSQAPEQFPGIGAQSIGASGASSYLFVAKQNPQASGVASLEWLTFLGGSGSQGGGALVVDSSGNAAVAGTTTSPDYPVTDESTLGAGGNSAVVTEVDQKTGATLEFSTMLGGNGKEWNENGGGVAIDGSGRLYVASDTTSTDLCAGEATSSPYQPVYGGGSRDGFFALYQPGATPPLRYCTYLGIFAEVGVTGLAVDTKQNAYLVGFTSQPVNPTEFPSTANGFQASYGGGDYDAFVAKLSPAGNGASDLSYASYLGGTGSDKAEAVVVDSSQYPATAYVAGTTDSKDFPTGAVAGFQTTQGSGLGGTNAFLAVVAQSGSGATTLQYATYLGGSQSDAAAAVAELAPDEVFLAGSATSADFPWRGNLQPLSADTDAFVAELDTTIPGSGGLLFATPLGGTPSPGLLGTTSASGLAVRNATDQTGNLELIAVGQTNTLDFPQAPGTTGNGAELTCASCPAAPSGFAVELEENPSSAPPAVEFAPGVVRFKESGPTTPVPVGIKNTGGAELTISSITLSQAGNDFSLSPTSPCSNQSLAPQSSDLCSFEVLFSGTGDATEGATIVIADNAPGGTQILQVAGISGNPDGVLSQTSLNFGNVIEGTLGGPLYVNLTNNGSLALDVTQISVSSGEFIVQATGGAGVGAGCSTIPSGMSCLLGVEFKPTTTGMANATLSLTDNSGNIPGTVQTVTLTGTGTSGQPIANIEPSTINFGQQSVGTTSGAQIATLANTGTSNLGLTSIAISGSAFAIATGWSNECPTQGGTLAPATSCVVPVTFSPQTTGSASASLNFHDNASPGEQSVALSGTGQGTIAASVTPASISFVSTSVGTKTAATAVTVANKGTATLEVTSISVVGTEAGDFPETTNCAGAVLPSQSCTVQVVFSPTAGGARSATLQVQDNAPGSPQNVVLSGTGTQAAATLSPASLNFTPAQLLGIASAAQTVTLSSTGNGALAVSGIGLTGADAKDFSETNNCSDVAIAAGKNCTIQVTFKPVAQDVQCGASATSRCATLNVSDNASNASQTVAITGSMMDFEIEPPAGGSFAQTVTAGGTATYNLEVDSIGGFSGSVTLSCPATLSVAATSCNISPASVNVAPDAASPFTVTVSTTGDSTTAADAPRRGGADVVPLACFVGALLLVLVCSQKRRKLAAPAMVVAVILLCGSCGGGGSNNASSDPPTGTPSGTYANAITITATTAVGSTSVQRTAQLTLDVQ